MRDALGPDPEPYAHLTHVVTRRTMSSSVIGNGVHGYGIQCTNIDECGSSLRRDAGVGTRYNGLVLSHILGEYANGVGATSTSRQIRAKSCVLACRVSAPWPQLAVYCALAEGTSTADEQTPKDGRILVNGCLNPGVSTVPEPTLGGSDRRQCADTVLDCMRAADGWISGDSTIRVSTQAGTGSFSWRASSPFKYFLVPGGHTLSRCNVSRPIAALAYGGGFEAYSYNHDKDCDHKETGDGEYRYTCMVNYDGPKTIGGPMSCAEVSNSVRPGLRQVTNSGLVDNPVDACLDEP